MNKKVVVVIAVIVVALAAYGGFYAYEMTYTVPEDIKVFKSELNAFNGSTPEEDITGIEKMADQIENSSSLTILPLSERQKIATELLNQSGVQQLNTTLNELKQNATNNRKIASRYNLLFRGDVARDIKLVYNEDIISSLDKGVILMDKIGQDIINGDNKAVANDYRELANLLRNVNQQSQDSANRLQHIITRLEG